MINSLVFSESGVDEEYWAKNIEQKSKEILTIHLKNEEFMGLKLFEHIIFNIIFFKLREAAK